MLDVPSCLEIFAEATDLVGLGEERLARQVARIDALRAAERDTCRAWAHLGELEHNLATWRACQTQIRSAIVLLRDPGPLRP